jgi:EAL domain-containing protein (putative c-di-GMP-specific phosphodiesterase class I)
VASSVSIALLSSGAGQAVGVIGLCGLIGALGDQMLHEGCQRLAQSALPWDLSVNVAPAQLRDAGFPATVLRTLTETGLSADRLILEITESVLAEDDDVLSGLYQLREHAIRIAVDDFGTGYSCLARLDTLRVDFMKVDKSLLHRAGSSGTAPLVDAAIALAHGLGLRVVVEGVETQQQADYLRDRGCDSGQGYFWTRPVAWAALPEMPHPAAVATGVR